MKTSDKNYLEKVGENIAKLRREKEKLKEELEQVKIQRDIDLRKLNKIVKLIHGK